MPGINRTGLPTSDNLFLGRGSLEFGPLNPTTGRPDGFRHLGNVTKLTINSEIETLPHFNSRSGVRQQDREIVLSQALNVGFTLDHATDFDNLALFLSGAATKDAANAAQTADVPATQLSAAAYKGRSYELRTAAGGRLYDLSTNTTHLVVTSGGASPGTTTLTIGVDYTVDYVWGTIFLLSTGAHADGATLYFTYDSQGSERLIDVVDMLTTSKLSGFLRYKGINPANSDKKILIDFHSVSVKADGEMSLISEEFTELSFSGVAEKNELGYPTSPVGRVITHLDA